MKSLLSLLIACAVTLTVQAGAAKSGKVADISHENLKQAIADGSITLIDVNGTKSYQIGHIPGAVDFQAVSADLKSVLPEDKNALVVAYCGNPNCGAYQRAVTAAKDLGYTNVAHYSKGIDGWKKAGEAVEKG